MYMLRQYNDDHCSVNLKDKAILTLPQDDLGASFFSPANSSANPHEQSAQAFRLPVVAHTGN